MAYDVIRSRQADRDLEAIFDHLLNSHLRFGKSGDEAFKLAVDRITAIHAAMARLGRAPHQGTLRPELRPGLRSVTKQRAIFYFEVDDVARRLRVLAVFFSGQDHRRAMHKRVKGKA